MTENIFKSVNIVLVNKLKMVYHKMGIDVHEVLDSAATKPFGFIKFAPGPKLGGHCIPIDPFYLTWKAREFEMSTRFIELAGEINTSMPRYVVDRCTEALNTKKKAINGSKVLIIGLAYKPDVDDMRESPTFHLLEQLADLGAEVDYFDTYVPIIPKTREHAHWTGKKSILWSEAVIKRYDLVLIATNHSDINYNELSEWAKLIVDTRNSMNSNKTFKA